MSLRVFVVLLLAFTAVGCANYHSINRETSLPSKEDANYSFLHTSSKAVHLDIKQRVVISKDGGPSGDDIVCAEPSPDALSAFASAAGGGANVQGYGNAAAALVLSEAASSVGLRTQSITLMRDALYRICEAYYNGQLTRADVKLLLTRTQDMTAAVVSIEQLTGAVVAQQAALGGSAASSATATMLANAEALAQARALEKKYTEELAAAKTAQDEAVKDKSEFDARYNAKKDAEKNALEAEKTTTEAKVAEAANIVKLKEQQLADIQKARAAIELQQDSSIATASASTTSTAALSGGSTGHKMDKEVAQAISAAVAAIVQIVVTKSYAPDQCMGLLIGESQFDEKLPEQLRDACLKLIMTSSAAAETAQAAEKAAAQQRLEAITAPTQNPTP